MALIIHKRKDGSVRLDQEEFPEEHRVTPRFLSQLASNDWGRVTLELETEQGIAVYELVEAVQSVPDDPNSPIVAFDAVLQEVRDGGS